MTKRALIVEDNPARVPALLAAVQRHGFACTHVDTGHAAISALREAYTLIVLGHDLVASLPAEKRPSARNGYHVALALARARAKPAAPPFVLLHTTNADGAARMAAVCARAGIPHAWLPFDAWDAGAVDAILQPLGNARPGPR